MGLSRDRGDRPRLSAGAHERRDDRRDDRGDRRDDRPDDRATGEMTARTAVPGPDCSGRQMTRRRLGRLPPLPAAPATGLWCLGCRARSGAWGVRNHPGDRSAILVSRGWRVQS